MADKAEVHDVAVVGAGPAGVAAAVYLKRAGMDVIVFEGGCVGGLARNANMIENYPGFPFGVTGPELGGLLERHLGRWGVQPLLERVTGIEKDDADESGAFMLATVSGRHAAREVVLATGTVPRKLGIPGEGECAGRSLFYEVADLVPRLKPGSVCSVIGGGDAAFDYSLTLAENGAIVELCYRAERPRCLALLEDRVGGSPSIHAHPCTMPLEMRLDEGRPAIRFEFPPKPNALSDDREIWVRPDFVLVAVGREPDTSLVSGLPEGAGTPGLHIVGDARGGRRQVSIAVGDAVSLAMDIEERYRESRCSD